MKPMRTVVRTYKNIFNAANHVPASLACSVIITRKCTQDCLQCSCPESDEEKAFMSNEDFAFIIDRLETHGTHFINISGGEPLAHPQLNDFMRYAAQKKFAAVQILTNMYAAPRVLESTIKTLIETGTAIQVSFDGFGEVADKLRGAKDVSKRVMAAIELLNDESKKRKRSIRRSLNTVINKMNLHQVPEIIDYAESIGWKINADLYRWSFSYHRESEDLKIEDSDELHRVFERLRASPAVMTPTAIIDGYPAYLEDDYMKRCPYLDCFSLGSKLYVGPNGDVKVCIGKPIGNLLKQTQSEMFKSEIWNERRRALERCRGCWNTCYTPMALMLRPRKLSDLRTARQMLKKG